jgi:hypothetical protein
MRRRSSFAGVLATVAVMLALLGWENACSPHRAGLDGDTRGHV